MGGIQRLIDGSMNIEPKIHRINLSGRYLYPGLKKGLGELFIDPSFIPEKRMPDYDSMLIKNDPNFMLEIFTYPNKRPRPFCYIEIHPRGDVSLSRYKEFLIWINQSLPNLKVSKVEYACDQYCYTHKDVENLFWAELRYLFVPYRRNAEVIGENLLQWGNDVRMNSDLKIGDVKIYERGSDDKKKGNGWPKKSLNRVRLEYTVKRTKLINNGIDSLYDFIRHPNFNKINDGVYKFKCFHRSKKLPYLWENYSIPDKNGNLGIFQVQYIDSKERVANVQQYLKDMEGFDELKKRLIEVWSQFDEDWEKSLV